HPDGDVLSVVDTRPHPHQHIVGELLDHQRLVLELGNEIEVIAPFEGPAAEVDVPALLLEGGPGRSPPVTQADRIAHAVRFEDALDLDRLLPGALAVL